MSLTEQLPDSMPISDSIIKQGAPLVFLRESDVFGFRKPGQPPQWLEHSELYIEIGKTIEASHITGLQKIRGMWRIYVDNLNDKVKLMTSGVQVRGKRVNVLSTNPDRLDGELTTRVRVKNIPLSVDDDMIKRTLTLRGLEVITLYREKLRINNKLTNCETGDRLVTVKSNTLQKPLPRFMNFGNFEARVIHTGQLKPGDENSARPKKCTKCLMDGHTFSTCPNDWVCNSCHKEGHKMSDCYKLDTEPGGSVSNESEESDHSQADVDESSVLPKPPENTDTGPSSPTSSSLTDKGRGELLQKSMVDFLTPNITPNKDKPKLVIERSPPTPADEYRDKCEKKQNKKHQRKK